MNKEKSRQRRQRTVIVSTIFLFSCLLTGMALFPKNYGQAEPNKTINSGEQKVASVNWTPVMHKPLPVKTSALVKNMNSEVKEEEVVEKQDVPEKEVTTESSTHESNQIQKKKSKEAQILSASSGFVYDSEIPMPEDHQKYLYNLCKERGLDYKKALAVIKHESVYDPSEVSETNDYGYFQVNVVNHKDLSKALNTPNKPLDPYVNINWGTYMLSDLYDYWKKKGVSGSDLDDYVWSSYNRGIGGFKEHGKATKYIAKVREALTDLRI